MHHSVAPKCIVGTAFFLVLLGYVAFARAASNEVNYDTAWTFVYDGGRMEDSTPYVDKFFDVKILPNGTNLCVGTSGDTATTHGVLVAKIDIDGKLVSKTLYRTENAQVSRYDNQSAHSSVIAHNGDTLHRKRLLARRQCRQQQCKKCIPR